MALYTSLTGLTNANTDLSVIANNIANVGSTGFKKSRADFGDIFANSAQTDLRKTVGIGSIFKGTEQQFSQGPLVPTGNTLDLALTGGGFFMTRSARGEQALTRNGAFALSPDRYIVDAGGARVLGFPVSSDGVATALGAAALQPLTIPQTSGAPQATGKIDLNVNLPSAAVVPTAAFDPKNAASYSGATSTTVFDSLGNPLTATVYYVRTSTPTAAVPTSKWDAHLLVGGNEVSTSASATTPATLTFDANGNLTAPTTGTAFQPFTLTSGGAALNLTLDQLPQTTQIAQPFSPVSVGQDGFASGRLESITIDTAGLVKASFTNGVTQALGQIALADVANPQGLKQLGEARWSQTGASGALLVGQAGGQGLGQVRSGSLERSNVELSNELVNLIVAQRDYQANAKAVETDGNEIQSILALRS